MTKVAEVTLFRRSIPALFAIAWLGCKGQVAVDNFQTGAGGAPFDPNMCSTTGVGGAQAPFGPGVGTGNPQFAPQLGTTVSQPVAPPAITGGTLLVLSDGKTAVAADPDRDAIYVVDLPSRTLTRTIGLQPGDEPGRLIEDAAGRVHVALRHGGAVVTCNPVVGNVIGRRAVCAAPRGLTYEPATDRIHVACHDGQLVSLPAAGGDPVRRLQLDDDLRDVLVDGDTLLVTRFRSAELLTVAADGTVTGRVQPPFFTSPEVHGDSLFTPSVAWRALPAPGGGTLMLHQRGMVDPVAPAAGGYGGPSPCDTIVHGCITRIDRDGTTRSGPALASLVLAVDMAVSPDGKQVAVVSAGNATNSDTFAGSTTPALTRVFLTDLDDATDPQVGCSMDGMHGPCAPSSGRVPLGATIIGSAGGASGAVGGAIGRCCDVPGTSGAAGSVGSVGAGGAIATGGPSGTGGAIGPCCAPPGTGGAVGSGGRATGGAIGSGGVPGTGGRGLGGAGGGICPSTPPGIPFTVGQPVAVAFDGSGVLVVQSREPAMLSFGDGSTLSLSTVSRTDTGHTLFHANAGGFLACASCHAEGNEDGRTWKFNCEGPRRTQSVQTGLAGTEPFHWDGDQTDFTHLMTDVFQGRMSGPFLGSDQGAALLSWLDHQPRAPKPPATDSAAVARGQALFQDPAHGCAICHAGSHMTNNQTVDVGTGGRFQVPSLIGIGSRAPYMHNGCARTLADRFGACGGGDQHGVTSTLSPADVSDLVDYLKTL